MLWMLRYNLGSRALRFFLVRSLSLFFSLSLSVNDERWKETIMTLMFSLYNLISYPNRLSRCARFIRFCERERETCREKESVCEKDRRRGTPAEKQRRKKIVYSFNSLFSLGLKCCWTKYMLISASHRFFYFSCFFFEISYSILCFAKATRKAHCMELKHCFASLELYESQTQRKRKRVRKEKNEKRNFHLSLIRLSNVFSSWLQISLLFLLALIIKTWHLTLAAGVTFSFTFACYLYPYFFFY